MTDTEYWRMYYMLLDKLKRDHKLLDECFINHKSIEYFKEKLNEKYNIQGEKS